MKMGALGLINEFLDLHDAFYISGAEAQRTRGLKKLKELNVYHKFLFNLLPCIKLSSFEKMGQKN